MRSCAGSIWPLAEGLQLEKEAYSLAAGTEDAREGARAFAESAAAVAGK